MSAISAVLVGLIACGGGPKDISQRASSGPSTQTAAQVPSDSATTAEPTDEGPVMEGDHSIIRQGAVGPLRIGGWKRQVMSFVYALRARAGRDSSDIIFVHGIGKDTATLTFQNDTLRKIFVTRVGPHTVDGTGIGTPFATIAGDPGATTVKRGPAKVATLSRLCGVEFATDSIALSPDSMTRKAARRPARTPAQEPETIQAISVGYCNR